MWSGENSRNFHSTHHHRFLIPKSQKNNLEYHASYKFVPIRSNLFRIRSNLFRIRSNPFIQVQKGSSTPSNTFSKKCGKQHTCVENKFTSVVNMYPKKGYKQTNVPNVPYLGYTLGTEAIPTYFAHFSNFGEGIIFI